MRVKGLGFRVQGFFFFFGGGGGGGGLGDILGESLGLREECGIV